jgi:hypothetical protein
MLRRWRILLTLWMLAGCAAASTATPETSLWGSIIVAGQAQQREAPTLLIEQNRLLSAWVSADDAGLYHTVWRSQAGQPAEHQRLQLQANRVYQQQLLSSISENVHLLWLDAHESGETRLFAALINPDLDVLRGPTLISDRQTFYYAAVPAGDGAVWTVWSGGLSVEPRIYAQYIDVQGRPRFPEVLGTDADWPTLVRDNQAVLHLFWQRVSTGEIYHAVLGDGIISQPQSLVDGATLNSGDRLEKISAGFDGGGQAHIFWNIARAGGERESWFSSGTLNGQRWEGPKRLGFELTSKRLFETGFNGGNAQGALNGDRWLSQAAPLDGQYNALAVAVVYEKMLSVVYLQAGRVAGYQEITPIQFPLIGAPVLLTDRDRHLYLSWAAPTANGYADMQFTSTRPIQ